MPKHVYMITEGQSNEADNGAGPHVYTYGGLPRGTLGGYFPKMAEKIAARRNILITRGSSAIGSTSIAHDKCGYLRAWSNNMLCTKGSYVLSNGGVWMSNGAAGTPVYSTVAPTGTASYTTGDGLVWVYKGAATGADVDGRVYRYGDANFDPNGYYNSALYGGINTAKRQGFAEIWLVIAFGQQDSSYSVPRAAYAAAYQAAIDMYLSLGVNKVFFGQSFHAPTGDAWVLSNLIPALTDIATYYAADPRVQFGVDLRTAMGVLNGTPAAGKVGRQGASDPHGNDPAIDAAGELWYQRLLALGALN